MDSEKKDPAQDEPKQADGQDAPADALSRTPEDLQEEQTTQAAANADPNAPPDEAIKKLPFFKRIFRRVNVYLLVFVLLLVLAGVIAVVNYLNSQKAPVAPDVASQQLSQDALKSLTNTDVTVGNTSQTLTIQGNAIIAGQTLMRGNVSVAGNIQTGGTITAPNLTVSASANLGSTQINNLQVATDVAIQGKANVGDLNVSGAAAFSGPITASQITVTNLILSGNAILQVPNHISFAGPSPNRSINSSVLGNGGSASINGSDTSGSVNVNSGNNPSPGCFITITFNQPYTSQPHVLISPVGQAAGQAQFYVTRTFTSFSICSADAFAANSVFSYDYFITN